MKILIVDYEQDVKTLFVQKFRKEIKSKVLEFMFAYSGEEALRLLEAADSPEVVYVFSDINMPGMTGFELLEKIKSQFSHIQVSMVSAYSNSDNYEKALKSGAKGFFSKPVDFESLRQEIAELLTNK